MSSSIDHLNNRAVQPNPLKDPELGASLQATAKENEEQAFARILVELPKTLELDFNKVENLMVNLSATHPFRPDTALGKQPELATIEASNDVQSAPVAPVGPAAAGTYVDNLRQVNQILASYDTRLQQVFDNMALSRSARKPELANMGVEYERLMTFTRQTSYRFQQAIELIPETLPKNTNTPIARLMPEFSAKLIQADSEFQLIYHAVQQELKQAGIALRSRF